MDTDKSILILGIGNSGRSDDGLGWAFCDQLPSRVKSMVEISYRYQLQIEDAAYISEFDQVVFVDATCDAEVKKVKWERVEPKQVFEFSTHALSAETIVSLCNQLYNKAPMVYMLSLRGEQWELNTGLSRLAKGNLKIGIELLSNQILTKPLELI